MFIENSSFIDKLSMESLTKIPTGKNLINSNTRTLSPVAGSIAYDYVAQNIHFGNNNNQWVSVGSGSGSGGLLENHVFVAKNGNDTGADGSISKPFLTVQAAMEYAWTTYVFPLGPQPTSPFTRPTVYVCAGTYDDGPLVLPPQICVLGQGFNHSRIVGDWTIDIRWANYSPPTLPSPPSVLVPNDFRSSWLNVGLFGNIDINFDVNVSNEGKLYAIDVRFGGNVTLTEKTANPVSNSATFSGVEFLGDVTLNGIPTVFEHVFVRSGTLYVNQSIGTGVDNLVTSDGSIGNIVITSTSPLAPVYDCSFGHVVQPGATLVLNGPYISIRADITSLPIQPLITFNGGTTTKIISMINQICFSDITPNRPTSPTVGLMFFDTTLGIPIWFNGVNWINAMGGIV